jgi:hypothetical protein
MHNPSTVEHAGNGRAPRLDLGVLFPLLGGGFSSPIDTEREPLKCSDKYHWNENQSGPPGWLNVLAHEVDELSDHDTDKRIQHQREAEQTAGSRRRNLL